MGFPFPNTHGCFSRGKKTQNAATAIVQFIPPWRNQVGAAQGVGTPVKPIPQVGTIHVTDFFYEIGTTAHTITILRPLNWTTFSADALAAQTVVSLTADPGSYSTAYRYPLPNGKTVPSTANNLIAANDLVLYQAANGQWVQDTVASVSGLAVTLTANVPTGGVLAGGLLYYFGITTDTDPTYNEAHQQFKVLAAASATTITPMQSQTGLWHGYREGDPMLFSSSNETTAGTFWLISGLYSKH